MKKLVLAFSILALATCVPPTSPAQSTSENSASYPTQFLVQWVYNCMQSIVPQYQAQGMPQQFAASLAMTHCSCVIDEFRKAFNQTEVLGMSFEDRAAFGETFAAQCVGLKKEEQYGSVGITIQ
jgi:hypothetical protein